MSVPVRDLLKMAENRMAAAGCTEAKLDAELLYRFLFKLDKVGFFKEWGNTLDDESSERYFELVDRRACGIPLQYITGDQEFMGFTFAVNENVLIPRQDTETLVETVLESIKTDFAGQRDVKILDLCCGSGAIGISLALLCSGVKVVGSDVSNAAVAVAEQNAKTLGAEKKISFTIGDLFEPFNRKLGKTKFDIIVTNPPYIKSEVIPTLQREVKDHEPLLALDGGEDGLVFYRRIIEEAPLYLKKGGKLFMEIGHDQARDITGLVQNALKADQDDASEEDANAKNKKRAKKNRKKEKVFSSVDIIKDLAGHDRVAVLREEEH